MEYFREKYRTGLINIKAYETMMEVLEHIQQRNYSFVEMLGEGTFGSVLKIKHLTSNKEYALKVVDENQVSEGEMNIWSSLKHENILPLISHEYIYFAKSYAFLTPVYPTTLEKKIFDPTFFEDKFAFTWTTQFLKQILAAVSYLHERDLSHLDIKTNNVLISEDKTAVLCDFGFLTSCKTPVPRCGLLLVYRCPEVWMTEQGFPEVNGKKFDVWGIGTLTFEIFRKMTLLRETSKLNATLYSWYEQIFPIIQKNFEQNRFAQLLRQAFPCSQELDHKIDSVISFIKSCLVIAPEKRPDIKLLQMHELFGGSFKNMELEHNEDVWCKTKDVP